jgi:hypothetical protein
MRRYLGGALLGRVRHKIYTALNASGAARGIAARNPAKSLGYESARVVRLNKAVSKRSG